MALTLARGETILYPMPYVEAERPPYVVTNQRLIERAGQAERVMSVRSLISASRAHNRPFAAIGALLVCLGLAAAAAGGYLYYTVMGMEAAPYTALLSLWSSDDAPADDDAKDEAKPTARPPTDQLPDDPSQPGGADDDHPEQTVFKLDVTKTRAEGIGLLALGGLFAMIGLRVFGKRRWFVVCRSRDGIMRILVSGETQQNIILATLQAVQ
jgi:hypothetical protein